MVYRSSVVSWSLLSAAPASTSVRNPPLPPLPQHKKPFQILERKRAVCVWQQELIFHHYAGRSPTSSTSESPVSIGGMPWDSETLGKYKYHPGGDASKEPRDAPSALNSVVVPNITASKEMHDKFNKWGKEGYP